MTAGQPAALQGDHDMPAEGDVVAVTRTENATFGKGLVKPEAADISAIKQSVNKPVAPRMSSFPPPLASG